MWRAAREHSRYSLREVAQILGVSKSTLHNWETGLTTPDTDSYRRLLGVYAKYSGVDRVTNEFFNAVVQSEPRVIPTFPTSPRKAEPL